MKTAKKIYIENIELFDYLLNMESQVTGKSSTNLIEEHIFNDIIKTKDSMFYVKNMCQFGLNDTLESLFEYISAGINWKSRCSNTRELVEFTIKTCMHIRNWEADDLLEHDILNWMDSLRKKVSYWLKDNKDLLNADYNNSHLYCHYKELYEWIDELIRIYSKDFHQFQPMLISNIILSGWEIFKDWTIPYRLLSATQHTLIGNRYSVDIVWEFIQILNKMTSEWDKK